MAESWDGDAANYSDSAYERACVLDRSVCGSEAPPKSRCSLPILDPAGKLNETGLAQAAARLNQVQACPAAKTAAAMKLRAAYKRAGKEPPASLK